MKINERKLLPSEIANLKKQKKKLIKKVLNDSIIVGVLTFFVLMVLLFICEKFRLVVPSFYSKFLLLGLSMLATTIYYLKGLHKLKLNDSSNKIVQYIFTITDYYCQIISNTEFTIYACKTTDNKTVVFQSSQLPSDNLFDTLIIDLFNNKIASIKNYTTGRLVQQINIDKQLIDSYEDDFYLLDKDFQNL